MSNYEDAPLVNPDEMRWYSGCTTNIRSVDMGEAGHFVQEDDPQRIRKEIEDW